MFTVALECCLQSVCHQKVFQKVVLPAPPTGLGRSRQGVFRNQPSVARAARVDRTTYPSRGTSAGTNRRTPLQSAGPRQAQGVLARTRLLERRRQHHTKPQSDQRNTNTHILSKWTQVLHQNKGVFFVLIEKELKRYILMVISLVSIV